MAVNIKEICVLILVLCTIGSIADLAQADGDSDDDKKTKSTPKPTTATSAQTNGTTAATATTAITTMSTSTVTPTPSPNYWYVVDASTSTVCILLNATINITVSNHTEIVPMPMNGSFANGTCGSVEENITIYFNNFESVLTLAFKEKSDDKSHYVVSLVAYTKNGREYVKADSSSLWVNTKGMLSGKQYKCSAIQQLYTNGTDSISVQNMQLEVFRTTNKTEFSASSPVTCPEDSKVSNLVPIIVGAALGGLILIVLIAYLIGRKRSRHGYEQV